MKIKIISKDEYLKTHPKPKQEEVWNEIAKPWKTYVVKRIPIVEEFLKGKKGKIIDLGCGTGRNMIPNENVEYWGVDFSNEQLKQAKRYMQQNHINGRLFLSRLDKLPTDFKDESFDYGLFISSLHCLETPEERLNSLKEFHRVLKKGAEALISVWNSEDKRFNPVGNRGDIYMSWYHKNSPLMRYYYLYKKQELLDLLRQVGFRLLEFYKPREKDRFSRKNWILRIKKL